MSRDIALLALPLIEALPDFPTPWNDACARTLRSAAAGLLQDQADAAAVLGRDVLRLVRSIPLVPYLEPGSPFGPAWRGHALASPAMDVGYKLREPDVTRELAALMRASSRTGSYERMRSFLRCLLELAGATDVLAILDGSRPTVADEHEITRSKRRVRAEGGTYSPSKSSRPRIDLMFEWPISSGPGRAVVVIEAKLGAAVTSQQLSPYRIEAQQRAKGGPIALILLTHRPDPSEKRNRSWRPVRWLPLMRRWESTLAAADDRDPEFARVRAHVWRFLLGR